MVAACSRNQILTELCADLRSVIRFFTTIFDKDILTDGKTKKDYSTATHSG